jgi:hypothetical protein
VMMTKPMILCPIRHLETQLIDGSAEKKGCCSMSWPDAIVTIVIMLVMLILCIAAMRD